MSNKIPPYLKTFLQACREFPRWMTIRKRIPNSAEKTISGAWLESVIKEQQDISAELDKFISEFFLLTYVGKESETPDYVYVFQVGDISYTDVILTKPELGVTNDGRAFYGNVNGIALLQEGYLMISAANLPVDGKIEYEYQGNTYGGTADRYHIWNIFDEFAMFLGLERFYETQETNAQLCRRCFRVFTDPTNATRRGLINTIKNAMINEYELTDSQIKIETPDKDNVWLNDDVYGSIFERLAVLNQDIARTKIWNKNEWEHPFKGLNWLPHPWDSEIKVFQDGTGQMKDCNISLSVNEGETTDISVYGYKFDQVSIDTWFHRENFRREIPLNLKKYNNVLNPKILQYRIKAYPTLQLDPTSVYLHERTVQKGTQTFFIQDLVTQQGLATLINPGALDLEKTYALSFMPVSTYSNMDIRKCDVVSEDGSRESLLMEKGAFVFKTTGTGSNAVTYLHNNDIKQHVTTVAQCRTIDNIIDYTDGLILGNEKEEGSLTLNVTGLGNEPIKIEHTGQMFDITHNVPLWTLNGLYISDLYKTLYSNSTVAGEQAILELDCMGFSYTLVASEDPLLQGSVITKVEINGKVNKQLSQTLSEPEQTVSTRFDQLSHVKITFVKNGSYSFTLKDIKATRYEITATTTGGDLVQTGLGTYLPSQPDGSGTQILTINVKNYDVSKPVIKCIHIGATTTRTRYEIRDIQLSTGQYLEIETDCIVKLYDTSLMFDRLIEENYRTNWSYRNDTINPIYLEIEIKNFKVIQTSSKKIDATVRNGQTVYYITLQPNETVAKLTIDGTLEIERARRNLRELLGLENYYELYVTREAPGFLISNPRNNTQWITTLQRSVFVPEANKFTFENIPEGTIGCFQIDREHRVVGVEYETDRYFDDAYIRLIGTEEYTAYNSNYMFTSPLDNVDIVNTFHPILSFNRLMYYVADSGSADSSVVFKKPNRQVPGTFTYEDNWSLGINQLRLITDIQYENLENYDVLTVSTEQLYSIANVIQLNNIEVDGQELNLAEYMITPPEYMEILYEETEYVEGNDTELFVEEDGFNKLKYSNITEVQSVIIDQAEYTDYQIIKDAGIIVWNNTGRISGHQYWVAYKYKKSVSLRYTDLSYLYSVASYNIEAYKPVNEDPYVFKNLEDGDQCDITFKEVPDKVVVECSNSVNFSALYDNGIVTVKRVYQDNAVVVNTGYYYDNGTEYFFYGSDHKEEIDRYQNIIFHNVLKYELLFRFMMKSNNYLPNTMFVPSQNRFEKLCFVNFTDPEIESTGVSKLDIITACDAYNTWSTLNLNIALKEGLNGVGMFFTADNESNYALLPLGNKVRPGTMISFYVSSSVKPQILREVKADGERMIKSILAEPFAILETKSGFRYYTFSSDLDMSYEYYLMLRIDGTGTLDDIIVRDGTTDPDEQLALHVKNIDRLGFDISEQVTDTDQLIFEFDRYNNILQDLEITKDGTLQIGSNVDWNLTKIFALTPEDMSDCVLEGGLTRIKDFFYADGSDGYLVTPLIYVPYHYSTVDLYIKVNNIVTDSFKNFDIRVYSTPRQDIPVQEVSYQQKTNLAYIYGSQSNSYVQARIKVPRGRIIDNLEVYVNYGETVVSPLRVETFTSGSFVSKVYDSFEKMNLQPSRIKGTFTHPRSTLFYVRAAREGENYMVWTDWYLIPTDDAMNCVRDPHIFSNYRFFQFKVETMIPEAQCQIQEFIMNIIKEV